MKAIFRALFSQKKKSVKPWLRGFVLFYANIETQFEHDPLTFKEVVKNLLDTNMTARKEQSILVWLDAYLMKVEGRHRDASDYAAVLKNMPTLLRSELLSYNSRASLRHFLSKQGQDNDENAISNIVQETSQDMEAHDYLQMELMRFRFVSLFEKIHKENIDEFSTGMLDEAV